MYNPYDPRNYTTADLQHDLALMLTDPEYLEDLIEEYTNTLKERGERLPVNVRLEPDIYHPDQRRLVYDLE